MIEPPQIVTANEQLTAIIHVTVAADKIQEVMGPTLQELMGAIAAQGIEPAGPWFTHHLRRPSDSFDFELSIPVVRPIAAAGRVRPSIWPAMKVARTVYHGDYEGLGDGWSEFLDWIKANGDVATNELWEVYRLGPETSSDPSRWRTELNQPLKGQ
jgi:effector-binding domain-containing protein